MMTRAERLAFLAGWIAGSCSSRMVGLPAAADTAGRLFIAWFGSLDDLTPAERQINDLWRTEVVESLLQRGRLQ